MFPLLMLIPSILGIGEKVLGGIAAEHKASIVSNILGTITGSPTANGLVGIFQNVMGNIEDSKRLELQAELETLLAQSQLDTVEAQSEHFFDRGWRPALAWGISTNIVLHYSFVNMFGLYNFIVYGVSIPPMDAMSLTLMTGLLGLYIGARSIEKFKGVN